MSLPSPVQEASEIVAGIAAQNPVTTEDDGYYKSCFHCGACDAKDANGAQDPLLWVITDHEPDCLWIRARRLTRLPIHPHTVRS